MTPLFKKLNFKAQPQILVVNAPGELNAELAQMAGVTSIQTNPALVGASSFIMAFVTMQTQVDALGPLLTNILEGDGVLWFCYPKGTSKKYKCDFNRDTGWNALANAGFEPVRMVAIDADWSALRFRRVQHIKTMTRSRAITEAGKKRIAEN